MGTMHLVVIALLGLACAQCVLARSLPNPARALRERHRVSLDEARLPTANVSNCGNFKCNSYSDCPVFSEFWNVDCFENVCEYTPDWSDLFCTETSQCATNTCICATFLTDGCACDYYGTEGQCLRGCFNGTCQEYGLEGEYCDVNYPCGVGNCSATNTCVVMQQGDNCNNSITDYECADGLYCTDQGICELIPPCSAAAPFNGTCPGQFGFCLNGSCVTVTVLQEGDPCIVEYPLCATGLTCTPPFNGSANGTCTSIPEGTPCTTLGDCDHNTQKCYCVEPSNNASKQCVNNQMFPCAKIWTVFEFCTIKNCLYTDLIPGTPCYDACNVYNMDLICCMVCNNQQYYDNAIFNGAGSCANGTFKQVECCNAEYPCSIVSVVDMCAGY